MSETLLATIEMLRGLKQASRRKVSRNFEAYFADRVLEAFTEASLVGAIERMAVSIDADVEYVGGKRTAAFMAACAAGDAAAAQTWIRRHPRLVAMLAALRDDEDFRASIAAVRLDAATLPAPGARVEAAPEYQVAITARCLSPLAHGADGKAGNATLFRRRRVMTASGEVLELPFYGGNAVRGQLRDLLADDLLERLGLSHRRDRPTLALWFFYALYSGGALEEGGGGTSRALAALLGKAGAERTDGLRELRARLPGLSLLGTALGNRVLPGRVYVGDLRPRCQEWGGAQTPAAELMDWEYLTRREDDEAHEEHHGMIAKTECLRAGSVLEGGIDVDTHATEVERGALGHALQLWRARGMMGAENRRGLGRVSLEIAGAPDAAPYVEHVEAGRETLLAWLGGVGALADARD